MFACVNRWWDFMLNAFWFDWFHRVDDVDDACTVVFEASMRVPLKEVQVLAQMGWWRLMKEIADQKRQLMGILEKFGKRNRVVKIEIHIIYSSYDYKWFNPKIYLANSWNACCARPVVLKNSTKKVNVKILKICNGHRREANDNIGLTYKWHMIYVICCSLSGGKPNVS